jgi:hypothetical protein
VAQRRRFARGAGEAAAASRLWVDTRDIPFLRDDERDVAEIKAKTLARRSGS